MTSKHPERADWGLCDATGCSRFVAVKKWSLCNSHYRRLTHERGKSRGLDLERASVEFWGFVDKGVEGECWLWRKAPHSQGHGTYWQDNVSYHAHIVAYRLTHGDIPVGLVVDHKCRNRVCVNPGHLQAVTRKENCENIGVYKNNSSGYRGVTQRATGEWRARVGHEGRVLHIGDFTTPEEANQAVVAARLRLHTNNLGDRGETYG